MLYIISTEAIGGLFVPAALVRCVLPVSLRYRQYGPSSLNPLSGFSTQPEEIMATNLVRIENDSEIRKRLEAERVRLRKIAGLDQPGHFHRPHGAPLHRRRAQSGNHSVRRLYLETRELLRAVFQGCGYRCQKLPESQRGRLPDRQGVWQQRAVQSYLLHRWQPHGVPAVDRARGLSRQEILDHYVFFTAGSCGPCRFGTYEAEYRMAFENAGFGGFRVLLFQQDHGINAMPVIPA